MINTRSRAISTGRAAVAVAIIAGANPIIKSVITHYLRSYNELLAKQKNSINFVSLSTVIFNALYFVYPDEWSPALDTALLSLMFALTRVQLHELLKAVKQLNDPRLKPLARNLVVSIMLVLRKDAINKVSSKVGAALDSLALRSKHNSILAVAIGLLTLRLGASFAAPVLAVVGSYLIIGQFSNTLGGYLAQIVGAFAACSAINATGNFPAIVTTLSFKSLTDALFTKLVPKQLRQGGIRRYKKFQSLTITLVIISLVRYINSSRDKDSPISEKMAKVFSLIDNGAFQIPFLRFGNTAPKKTEEAKENLPEETTSSRRGSLEDHKGDLKIYDNDYSLVVDDGAEFVDSHE